MFFSIALICPSTSSSLGRHFEFLDESSWLNIIWMFFTLVSWPKHSKEFSISLSIYQASSLCQVLCWRLCETRGWEEQPKLCGIWSNKNDILVCLLYINLLWTCLKECGLLSQGSNSLLQKIRISHFKQLKGKVTRTLFNVNSLLWLTDRGVQVWKDLWAAFMEHGYHELETRWA